MTVDELKDKYLQICEALQIRKGEANWEKIVRSYSEPARTYHNLRHLCAMGDRVIELIGDFPWPALWLALIYHDLIYVPGFSDNEEQSALCAALDILNARTNTENIAKRVEALILLTKHHDADESDKEGQVLVDADLYELSTPRYSQNALDIREEFHEIPYEQWEIGRMAFLESFLARPTIFSLQAKRGDRRSVGQLNSAARHSMKVELESLTGMLR